MNREVTERDFRAPEFRDAKVQDYEFRADGKIVRKDRWETAVQSIRRIVGIDAREFEIDDVVNRVAGLRDVSLGFEFESDPETSGDYDVILRDQSILRGATYLKDPAGADEWAWRWRGVAIQDVTGWREPVKFTANGWRAVKNG